MQNPWFRMYHELATDPKIQMLSEADQRRYIMLLCFRCCNGDVTLQDSEVAFQLRIDPDQYAQTKRTLIERNLIDKDNKPSAWDKRQFVSDSSTARVTAYRERKKKEEKQECNVSCNDKEIKGNVIDTEQNRTDTESKQNKKVNTVVPAKLSLFDKFWQCWPVKRNKKKASDAWKRKKLDAKADMIIADVKMRQRDDTQWLGGFIPHASTYLNGERWNDEKLVMVIAKKNHGNREAVQQAVKDMGGMSGSVVNGEVVQGG